MTVKHDYSHMATRVKAVDLGNGTVRLDFDCALGGYAAHVSVQLHPEQVQALIRDLTGIAPATIVEMQERNNDERSDGTPPTDVAK